MYAMLLSKHLSSVVMKVDHKLPLVYVDSNVFFFACGSLVEKT